MFRVKSQLERSSDGEAVHYPGLDRAACALQVLSHEQQHLDYPFRPQPLVLIFTETIQRGQLTNF
jgi:hypothetical protein